MRFDVPLGGATDEVKFRSDFSTATPGLWAVGTYGGACIVPSATRVNALRLGWSVGNWAGRGRLIMQAVRP